MKKPKKKAATYYTIGVRFLDGPRVNMVYTYRVRRGNKVHLGQELIADTPRGSTVVVCVRIDITPQDTEEYDYKYITRKVAPL